MTEVRPRGKQSSLSDNSEKASEWQNGIPDISEIYRCKSYDELSKIVNDWINDDATDTDESEAAPTSTTSSDTGNSSGYSNIDDAFADLMTDK